MFNSIGNDYLSSGSGFKDAISGLFGGLGSNKGKKQYYTVANWIGDGRADVGLGSLDNQYGDQYDRQAHGLSGLFGYQGNGGFGISNGLSSLLGSISSANVLNKYQDNPFNKTLTDNIFDYANGNGLPNYGTSVSDVLNLDKFGDGLSI